MKTPSVALAFSASFAAAVIFAVSAMPPEPVAARADIAAGPQLVAQAKSDAIQSGEGNRSRETGERRERQREKRIQADCHRDVRTHRINGKMVTHRHVGENCEVRVVDRSRERIPR